MKNGDQPINHITEAEKDRHDASKSLIYLGLTKREHFAAMAMQGMCNKYFDICLSEEDDINTGSNISKVIAMSSVHMADELLAELEKPI